MNTTIYLIRHGQSQSNVEGIFAGHLDTPLSELGEKQAELLKEYLLTQKIDAVYSSDLMRAKATVTPYANQVGLPVITDRNLREIYGGDWEGKEYALLPELYPVEYGKYWLADTENTAIPNGETVKAGMQRAIDTITRIAKDNLGRSIAIATHGGIIRGFESKANDKKWSDVSWVQNASVTKVVFEDGKFTTLERNINAHLGKQTSFLPKGV